MNFSESTPLDRIVVDLERIGQTLLVFDGPALRAQGISRERKATLVVHEQSFAEALVSVLQPLGLTFRIVDARVPLP